MRDYGFISDSAVCSGSGTPDDKINQCFGNWIDGIKCECNAYLSYDYNHHDSHYDCKHVCIKAVFAFHLTIFSIIVSTYVGYYFGVCDANMVLLTATSLKNLSQNGKFLLDTVNQNPFVTLALYYVVPRSLMAIAFFM